MKYQLQPETAILNNSGITTHPGWRMVFNVNSQTNEYQGSTYQFLPAGVGLPAQSYLDAPKEVDDDHAIVRQDDKWIYPTDYRGKRIYSIETGAESIVTFIGDIPDDFTLLKPNSDFDSWNGKKWVLDKDKQHQYEIAIAQSQQLQLLNGANSAISNLQDAVDADIATEHQREMLKKWKKYRFELNQIDVNTAPDIDWPEKPE
ncbi:tail fiber assembly protein [Gilliamella sp. ESL0443]|uniref:tail fiber assembly protein n=1 Tax=Gilliamella sp. ESL0443 TaxID=2704655 RepID=UPI001C69B673|nr:tail fiber assembly protein [Gilliamella sp. ESL0443]QYN42213.1 tail fiber assembly protein [Gilliamella sp. ESL0443]